MNVDITVSNFRCFSYEYPATFTLRDGFTSFVGPNNVGKSTLLKLFYELRSAFEVFTSSQLLSQALQHQGVLNLKEGASHSEMFCNRNSEDAFLLLRFDDLDANSEANCLQITLKRDTHAAFVVTFPDVPYDPADANTRIGEGKHGWELTYSVNNSRQVKHISRICKEAAELGKCAYVGPFRNIIGASHNEPYYDLTVGQLLIDAWGKEKHGDHDATRQLYLRVTKDVKDIFNLDHLDIDTKTSRRDLHVIVNDQSYGLRDLGSGIAHFIMVLVNIARLNPSFVLMDEPEMHLHASFQKKFLEAVNKYARSGVVFSTHNLALAKVMCGDRIYSIKQDADHNSTIASYEHTPDMLQFISELIFAQHEETGIKKVLFVEGPTEMKAFTAILKKYKLESKILLLPLGGDSLATKKREHEIVYFKVLSYDLFAIVDSEKIGDPNKKRLREEFKDMCQRNGIQCLVTEHNSIENYFSDQAIKAVKGNGFRALAPTECLRDSYPRWNKDDNHLVFEKMTVQELDATDIGKFIRTYLADE